ncbi:MAG: hypothetical protein ACOC2H_00700 [Spirochaetota bacterium]
MKKRKYSCEQLSEIFDRATASAAEVTELYPDICNESLQEYYQLQETVRILRSMSSIRIRDPRTFCYETLQSCTAKKHFRHSAFNRIALPAAAAVIVAAGALSFNAYNDAPKTGNSDISIASAVESEDEFVITLQDKKDAGRIKSAVINQGGVILDETPTSIKAKASIANYIVIKKDLTLSEEDRQFFNRNRNLMMAGSNSNVYSSDYVDQTIMFTITFEQQ